MYLSIFVLVSPGKEKTMTCLKNQQNNNSLSEQFLPLCDLMQEHPPWWGWGEGVECAITFRKISVIQQLYGIKLLIYTTLMLFNLMLTFKPCTKINLFRGCICNTIKCYKCWFKCNDVDNHVRSGGMSNTPAPQGTVRLRFRSV